MTPSETPQVDTAAPDATRARRGLSAAAAVLVAGALVSFGLGGALHRDAEARRGERLEDMGATVRSVLVDAVAGRDRALRRLAARFVLRGEDRVEEWEQDVRSYLADYPGLRRLAWMGPEGALRLEERKPGASRGPGFSLEVHLMQDGRGHGALVADFDLSTLLDTVLGREVPEGWDVQVAAPGGLAYHRLPDLDPETVRWTSPSPVRVRGAPWEVRVGATPSLVEGGRGAVMLGTGLGLGFTLLLAAAVHLGLTARERAAALAREVDRRAAAERDVQALNLSLARRNEDLRRSNRDLEAFASVASHDLQAPLRKIRSFAERVRDRSGDELDPKARDYLGRVVDAAARMQLLVDELLEYSRLSRNDREAAVVDLDEVLDGVMEDLEVALEESGATLEREPLGLVRGDPGQLRRLLQNLLSNAVKFRAPGHAPRVRVRGQAGEGGVRILEVEDDGIGFEKGQAAALFGLFRRLHGAGEYPGTGIGLASCRRIAESHGGSIEACGRPGEGATFTVRLPAA